MAQNKISIAFMIDRLSSGGAQTHLLNVLRYFDYDKYDVCLVCVREAGGRFDFIQDLPVETLVCDLENLVRPMATVKALFSIRRFFRKRRVKILQAYMFNPNMLAGLVKISMPGLKLITTRRDMGYWHKKHHWTAWRLLNRLTSLVIAVSEQTKQQTIKMEGISSDDVITIPNGVDTDQLNPAISKRPDEFAFLDGKYIVGMMAIFRYEKRHDVFINAAKFIREKIPGVHFVFIGQGYPEVLGKIQQQISDMCLEGSFTFTDRRTDIPEVLSMLDVSVLCSDTEGMSNTLLESMSMERCIVATRVGGNPELIQNGQNGVLVPNNDPQALANAVIDLYENPELSKKLAQAARQTALEKYHLKSVVSRMMDVYPPLL